MNDQSDAQLLRAYAEQGSEQAFRELVLRHLDLVHSAALRMVQDAHLAQDVSQGVFVTLARNAQQLTQHPVLVSWLHRTTQNIAAQTIRTDSRRRQREKEAATMNEQLAAQHDVAWEEMAPQLDSALGELADSDRCAILLRYFKQQSAAQMGATLGIRDEAAQKRVNRAVERLREIFSRRGVKAGVSGLTILISANSVQAAPVGLAVTISTAALAGTAATASTAIAVTTKTIAMTVFQKTLVTATVAILAGAGIYEAKQAYDSHVRIRSLQNERAALAEQIRRLETERDEATSQVAGLLAVISRLRIDPDRDELLRLRGEVTQLRTAAQSGYQTSELGASARSWLERVNQLKQRLAQSPERSIPELQFLTEEDWLNAASRRLDTEVDFRRALSSLRIAAKGNFAKIALDALKKYQQASHQFPTDASDLGAYVAQTVDDAVWRRYKVVAIENLPVSLSGRMAIAEAAPVDEEYDSRLVIGQEGFTLTDFRNFPMASQLWQAYMAYSAANPGKILDEPAELAPYLTTAEQKAALESVMRAVQAFKKEHQGRGPSEISDLQPYLNSGTQAKP